VYPSPTIIPKTAHTPPIKQSPRTSPKKNGFACRNCFKPPYLSNIDLTNHPIKIENHRLFNGHSPGEETNPIGCNGHQIKLLRIQYRPVIIANTNKTEVHPIGFGWQLKLCFQPSKRSLWCSDKSPMLHVQCTRSVDDPQESYTS